VYATAASNFAESFSKSASPNPSLRLDNRFLGAVPRAFEKRPGLICPVFKPVKYVYDKQFSFEKPAEK
jgi:hypothetical protein